MCAHSQETHSQGLLFYVDTGDISDTPCYSSPNTGTLETPCEHSDCHREHHLMAQVQLLCQVPLVKTLCVP